MEKLAIDQIIKLKKSIISQIKSLVIVIINLKHNQVMSTTFIAIL